MMQVFTGLFVCTENFDIQIISVKRFYHMSCCILLNKLHFTSFLGFRSAVGELSAL